jgi:hypothetical protein
MNRYFQSSIKNELRKSQSGFKGATILAKSSSLVGGGGDQGAAQSNILDRIRQANKMKLGSASCM